MSWPIHPLSDSPAARFIARIRRTNGTKRLPIAKNVLVLAERGGVELVWIASQAVDRHDVSGFEVSPRPCRAECCIVADNLDLAFGGLEDGLQSAGALVFAVEENAPNQLLREWWNTPSARGDR